MSAIGKVNARLIYNWVEKRIDTSVHCIADVKEKYKQDARDAYKLLYGKEAPETDPYAEEV